jgi:hypothetical protein
LYYVRRLIPEHGSSIQQSSEQSDNKVLTEASQADVVQTSSQVTFEDASNVIHQESVNKLESLFSSVNPFPDDTPTGMLTRNVFIGSTPWTNSFTSLSYDPLQSIINASAQIKTILGDLETISGYYRYLRCGFEITVEIASTPYHQGTLVCSWFPPSYQPYTGYNAPQVACSNHGVILSASLQDKAVVKIPFIYPDPHFDLATYSNNVNVTFMISVLNPLISSSASITDSVPINVYMKLVDPKVYGWQAPSSLVNIKKRDKNFGGAHSTISRGDPSIYEKVTNQSSGSRDKHKVAKESQAKNDGVTIKGLVDVVEPLVKPIPLVGTAATIVRGILDNLDKPQDDSPITTTELRLNKYTSTLTGKTFGDPLGSFPISSVTKDLGMVTSDMRVVQYAQMPAFVYTTSFSGAGPVFSLPIHPMKYYYAGNGRTLPDNLAFATAPFAFWRGSIRYLIQFVGTAFYSTSVRVSVYYGVGSPTASTGDGVPLRSRIVNLKGDGWTEIEVPYLGQHVWEYTDPVQTYAFYYLVVEAMTAVQGSNLPATAKYYVNVFRAAGSDYQLSLLQGVTYVDTAGKERVVNETSLREKFETSFAPITQGMHGLIEQETFMSDQSTTISDCCKRAVPNPNPDGTTTTHYTYPAENVTTNPVLKCAFHWFSLGFAYWRGSRNYMYMDSRCDTIALQPVTGSSTTGCGISYGFVQTTGSVYPYRMNSVNVPYYNVQSYYPTIACNTPSQLALQQFEPQDIVLYSQPSQAVPYLAAGDDFVFLHPVAPFPYIPSSLDALKSGVSSVTTTQKIKA